MSTADDSLPPSRPTLHQAFEALVSTFDRRGIRYAIIGGIAVIQYARIRTTDDIDALLTIPQVEMAGLFETLRARGFDLDVAKCIRELRDDGFTACRFSDVLVDLLRPVIPAYSRVLDRATDAEIFGKRVRVCSAEGLIITKLMAMRPQDQADIIDILTAHKGLLDLDFIRSELATFSRADDPRIEQFERWVREAQS